MMNLSESEEKMWKDFRFKNVIQLFSPILQIASHTPWLT